MKLAAPISASRMACRVAAGQGHGQVLLADCLARLLRKQGLVRHCRLSLHAAVVLSPGRPLYKRVSFVKGSINPCSERGATVPYNPSPLQ